MIPAERVALVTERLPAADALRTLLADLAGDLTETGPAGGPPAEDVTGAAAPQKRRRRPRDN
jgi:hypothetical protein